MAARVLIIDDDPDYRNILREIGVSRGWDVRTCASGREGLEEARRIAPQLIVTDVALGDIDGFSLCEKLRQEPALRSVPIIMITGTYRMGEDRQHGLESGADAYLLKPFGLDEFLRTASILLKS